MKSDVYLQQQLLPYLLTAQANVEGVREGGNKGEELNPLEMMLYK